MKNAEVNNNVNQYLTALKGANFWRLFVDGFRQDTETAIKNVQYKVLEANYGHLFWAMREPNGLNVLKNTAKKLFSENLNSELSFEFIKEINHSAYPFQDYLRLSTSYMLEGDRSFCARLDKNELNWINKRANEIKKFVKSKAVPWKIIQNDSRFFEIATEWSYEEKIKHYNTLHNQYKKDVVKPFLNKLEVIVQFMQDIECLHIFADGNCRMIYLLLNKELMKHGFDPVILFNPNEFDYKTIKELIKEIEKGQQAFKYFIENGVPYASCVSDEQIAQNIENWENKKGVVGENDEVGDHVFFKKYIEFIETSQVAIAAMLEHHKKQVQVSVGQEQLLNQFVAMTNKVGQSLVMKEYYSIKNKLFKVGTFCTTEQKAVNDWMRKNWTTEVIPTLQQKENKIIDFLEYLDQTSTIGYLTEFIKGEGQTLKNKCDIIELTKFFSVYLDKLKLLCEKYINDYDIESLSNPLLCHLTISEQKALLPIEEVEIPNIESLHLDAIDEVENLGDSPEITEI